MLQEYLFPETVADAVSLLKSNNGQARILAGGTDLLLDLPNGKVKADCLLDITRIPELKELTIEDGVIKIGAAVTHNQVAKSELILEKATALAQGSRSVGSLQIRNSGTVVGNVVNAQPAADAAVALVALGAVAEIVWDGGCKTVSVEKMYAGVGKSVVDSNSQLVTCVKIPARLKNQGSSLMRMCQRKALALPMLNVAAMVSMEGEKIEWARIVMAPVGPGPVRATSAEEILKGNIANDELINKAAAASIKEANPRSSAIRGSKEYRTAVLPVLVKRALLEAIEQANS